MKKHLFLGLTLITVGALSACDHYSQDLAMLDNKMSTQPVSAPSTDYNQIETAAGGMSPALGFNDQLAKDYYTMARYENDEAMDYKAARVYTDKAKAAMKGQKIIPEQPNRTLITNQATWREITLARAELISALETQRSIQNDTQLARALASYDCWVDQAEENKEGENALCAAQFEEAMMALSPVSADQMRFVISFMPGQSALATGAKDTIGRVIAALEGTTPQTARLSFAGAQNDDLSAERAAALRSVLQFNGVDPAYFAADNAAAIPAASRPETVEIVIEKTTDNSESNI